MTNSDLILDYIPENVPERSVTSDGVNYPAIDSDGAPWEQATIRVRTEQVPLADQSLEGIPVTDMELADFVDWDEVDMALVCNFPGGWQSLLLLSIVVVDGVHLLEGVSVPTDTFQPGYNPPQWRLAFATNLKARVDAGVIDVVGDNLDILLSWASENY